LSSPVIKAGFWITKDDECDERKTLALALHAAHTGATVCATRL
jgi:hypothetical protein